MSTFTIIIIALIALIAIIALIIAARALYLSQMAALEIASLRQENSRLSIRLHTAEQDAAEALRGRRA